MRGARGGGGEGTGGGEASLRLSVAKVLLTLGAGFTAVRRALGIQNFPSLPPPSRMTFPVEPLPPSYLPPRVPALRRGLVRQRHRARASGDGAGLLETDAKRSPTEEEGEGEGEELRQEGEGPSHLGLRRALLSRAGEPSLWAAGGEALLSCYRSLALPTASPPGSVSAALRA